MPKITVIVPVYKTEKYIKKCAISLFEQTLTGFEIIFIDDCTPDNSIELIKGLIQEYNSLLCKENKIVRILKMPKNSGLAAVRKYGILHANGDYIIHCDSDDWVDTNLYESLYKKAIESNAEVVIFPVTEEWGNKSIFRKLGNLGNDCQLVLKKWYKNSIQMYTVNKLVKSSVYKDNQLLPYDGINMWEDNGLMLRVFYYAKGLAQIDDATYHYFRGNEQALTHSYGRNAVDQMIQCAYYLYDFFKEKKDFEEYEKTALAIKFLARINLITTTFSGLKEYYKLFPESDVIIPHIGKMAFSSKGIIRYYFVRYHLEGLFIFIFKIISILKWGGK